MVDIFTQIVGGLLIVAAVCFGFVAILLGMVKLTGWLMGDRKVDAYYDKLRREEEINRIVTEQVKD